MPIIHHHFCNMSDGNFLIGNYNFLHHFCKHFLPLTIWLFTIYAHLAFGVKVVILFVTSNVQGPWLRFVGFPKRCTVHCHWWTATPHQPLPSWTTAPYRHVQPIWINFIFKRIVNQLHQFNESSSEKFYALNQFSDEFPMTASRRCQPCW